MADGAFVELRERGGIGWVHRDLAGLGLSPFWAELLPLADAKGRGGIGTLELGGHDLVVRPYRRGGAFGALLKDRYPGPARARRELQVLAALRAQGVPVVAPMAAVARRVGAFWRLRLCTERLLGALPLPQFLARHANLRRRAAEAVGAVVRLAWTAGLRHPDLHVDNVLCVPSGERVRVVLVDLDRATLAAKADERAHDGMLVRMQRYLLRHRDRLAAVPTRAETQRFLRGLGLDRAQRRATRERLAPQVSRAMRRRRLLRG